jgi:3-oxoacyl-[acyl-carrier-protein] synthase-1
MIYVHDYGAISALGGDLDSHAKNLSAGFAPGFLLSPDYLVGGEMAPIGRVMDALPTFIGNPYYRSRNNQLLLAVLSQIRHTLDEVLLRYTSDRIAIVLGTSTAGIAEGERALQVFQHSESWPDDYHYAQQELASPSQWLGELLSVTGPCYTISTACSSSARALISAQRLLLTNTVDTVIVGGADSLCRLTLNGFKSLESLARDRCNPFSRNRQGIHIGEAAALFVLSREPNFCGKKSTIALHGVGESSDAHHISAPHPEGVGAERAMRMALDNAGLTPSDIGYINLHGTATPLNDAMESKAVARLFGDKIPCSSTKALTGHTLGAAGALEAVLSCLLLSGDGSLPAQVWDGEYDGDLPAIGLLQNAGRLQNPFVLSSSFAFGGNNAAVIFGRVDE